MSNDENEADVYYGLSGEVLGDGTQRVTMRSRFGTSRVFETRSRTLWGAHAGHRQDSYAMTREMMECLLDHIAHPDAPGQWVEQVLARIPADRGWRISEDDAGKACVRIVEYCRSRWSSDLDSKFLCDALRDAIGAVADAAVVPTETVMFRFKAGNAVTCVASSPVRLIDVEVANAPDLRANSATKNELPTAYVNAFHLFGKSPSVGGGFWACKTSECEVVVDVRRANAVMDAHAACWFAADIGVDTQMQMTDDGVICDSGHSESAKVVVETDVDGHPRGYFGGMEWGVNVIKTGEDETVRRAVAIGLDRRAAPSQPQDFDRLEGVARPTNSGPTM